MARKKSDKSQHVINIGYVFFWGVVSFVATFMVVLEGDWSFVVKADLLKGIFCPLFMWIAAFFGDYLYNILTMNREEEILDTNWTTASYIFIELIFILLVISAYWSTVSVRTFCFVSLYLCMLGLKMASLYAVCPHQKVVPA